VGGGGGGGGGGVGWGGGGGGRGGGGWGGGGGGGGGGGVGAGGGGGERRYGPGVQVPHSVSRHDQGDKKKLERQSTRGARSSHTFLEAGGGAQHQFAAAGNRAGFCFFLLLGGVWGVVRRTVTPEGLGTMGLVPACLSNSFTAPVLL